MVLGSPPGPLRPEKLAGSELLDRALLGAALLERLLRLLLLLLLRLIPALAHDDLQAFLAMPSPPLPGLWAGVDALGRRGPFRRTLLEPALPAEHGDHPDQ